jgi:hypothetical protein
MKARQRTSWTAGLAIAIAAVGSAQAQQAPSSGVAAGTATVPRSTFADIRAPQSIGFNPSAISPFSPNIRGSFSGAFGPTGIPVGVAPIGLLGGAGVPMFSAGTGSPFFADIRTPQSFGFNPGIVSPFAPNFRQPLTGTFNPAANVPFNGVIGASTNVPVGIGANTAFSPVFTGDGTTGFANGTPFFVFGPTGATLVTPVAVPVAVPVPVPVAQQPATAAARGTTARRAPASVISAQEGRSLQAARQLMARTPLTEGTIVSADSRSVRVRVGGSVRGYTRSQVFYFTANGEMRSGAAQPAGLTRGRRVLVPAPRGA